MKKHIKIYFNYFRYGEQDFIGCEACGSRAVDVHHIKGRGKGKDVIENLVALCRACHNFAHSDKEFNKKVEYIHKLVLRNYEQKR
tara:strand:+ start:3403 stop:3657 length:255 start_codon:yes stop_codon:yes gene_type:complete